MSYFYFTTMHQKKERWQMTDAERNKEDFILMVIAFGVLLPLIVVGILVTLYIAEKYGVHLTTKLF